MNPEDIIKMTEAYKKVKEKLDPVGQEDGDINNDGEIDSSDKYLAKRRRAIGKAMNKESSCGKGKIREEDKVECPKCEGKGCSHCDDTGYHMKEDVEQVGRYRNYKLNPEKQRQLDRSKQRQLDRDKIRNTKEEVEQVDELKKSTLARYVDKARNHVYANAHKAGQSFQRGTGSGSEHEKHHRKAVKRMKGMATATKKLAKEDVFSERELIALEAAGVFENKQTQGATAPETMQDKIKGGNSKKFAAMHKHPKDDSHSIADYDEKGHDDASKAGRATKQAPARRADNLNNGDSKSPKKA